MIASIGSALTPGCTSARRIPSRLAGAPPPNRASAALDHTNRRSVSTIAMPMGEPETICSSTPRSRSQPGAWAARPTSCISSSQREGPCTSAAEVMRTISLTGRPSRRRAVSSPAQPPSVRQWASSPGSRAASSSPSSRVSRVPTTSAAGYASSRPALPVQLVITPSASSSTGAASATPNQRRATSWFSSAPTTGLSVAERGPPPRCLPSPCTHLGRSATRDGGGTKGAPPGGAPCPMSAQVRRPPPAPSPARPAPRSARRR